MAVTAIGSTPAVLRALLAGLPDAVVSHAAQDEWSARDVVAHLLSISSSASLERVRLMLEHDGPEIANVDEEAVLRASGMRAWTLDRLLDALSEDRRVRMAMLERLTAGELCRQGRHQIVGAISIADVVNHVAYHDLLHIHQISAILAAQLEQRRGAMRAF